MNRADKPKCEAINIATPPDPAQIEDMTGVRVRADLRPLGWWGVSLELAFNMKGTEEKYALGLDDRYDYRTTIEGVLSLATEVLNSAKAEVSKNTSGTIHFLLGSIVDIRNNCMEALDGLHRRNTDIVQDKQ